MLAFEPNKELLTTVAERSMNITIRIPAADDTQVVVVAGRPLLRGSFLFDMKDTQGLPIDFALDAIMERGFGVEWPSFIERARRAGWWDFQTYRVLRDSLQDSSVPRGTRDAILDAFQHYVQANPHLGNAATRSDT
jgi:hypothetical protein